MQTIERRPCYTEAEKYDIANGREGNGSGVGGVVGFGGGAPLQSKRDRFATKKHLAHRGHHADSLCCMINAPEEGPTSG